MKKINAMALLVVFILFTSFTTNTQEIGQQVSNITLPTKTGQMAELNQLSGNYVMLHFWASWCPCSVPHIENYSVLYDKYKKADFGDAKGFEIYSVSVDDDPAEWQAAMKKYNMKWKNNVLEQKKFDSPFLAQYNVERIPAVFLIDPQGSIIAVNPSLSEIDKTLSTVSNMPWPEYSDFGSELTSVQNNSNPIPIYTGVTCKGKNCQPKVIHPIANNPKPKLPKKTAATLVANSNIKSTNQSSVVKSAPKPSVEDELVTASIDNDKLWEVVSPPVKETSNNGTVTTTTTIRKYPSKYARSASISSTQKVKVGGYQSLSYDDLTKLSDLGRVEVKPGQSGRIDVVISQFVNDFSSSDILAVVKSRGYTEAAIVAN